MLMEFAGKLCWNRRPAEKSFSLYEAPYMQKPGHAYVAMVMTSHVAALYSPVMYTKAK